MRKFLYLVWQMQELAVIVNATHQQTSKMNNLEIKEIKSDQIEQYKNFLTLGLLMTKKIFV